MNFFRDKRFWYVIVAVIVVVIVAAVFWSRNQTMEPSVPAATNSPAAPSTTPPKQ
jgi:flagellar biosynthesis/type III secretory pathway M-ring protein FliF/YscJ